MNLFRSLARIAASTLLAASLLAPAWAQSVSLSLPSTGAEMGEHDGGESDMLLAQSGDCYALGERVAAENGGTLARVNASTQGGREVCVVVVLVPARDGQRPRREEIVVPLN